MQKDWETNLVEIDARLSFMNNEGKLHQYFVRVVAKVSHWP